MKRRATKFAAAAAAVAAVAAGLAGVFHNGAPPAYALEQTVEAMQGKRSIHVKVYGGSRTHLKEEFWIEFDEHGKVVRYRQVEGPIVTVWEDGVRRRRYGNRIALMSRVGNTEGTWDEVDPELAVQQLQDRQAAGKVTIEIQEPSADQPLITLIASRGSDPTTAKWREVLLVDPVTKLVNRRTRYHRRDDDEDWKFRRAVEVVGYNQPTDPNLFRLNLPEDMVVLDQVAQEVGIAQGDLSDEEVAVKIVREALAAEIAADHAKVGKLFGGAPPGFFGKCLRGARPTRVISVGQPVPVRYRKPWFRVPCKFEVEQGGEKKILEMKLHVLAVDGQPGRWYLSIHSAP